MGRGDEGVAAPDKDSSGVEQTRRLQVSVPRAAGLEQDGDVRDRGDAFEPFDGRADGCGVVDGAGDGKASGQHLLVVEISRRTKGKAGTRVVTPAPPEWKTAVEDVEMADQQAGYLAHGFEGVPEEHRIRMPAPEGSLPAVAGVVGLGEDIQSWVVGRKGTCAMPGEVAAEDAQMPDGHAEAESGGNGVDGGSRRGARGRVRVEPAPFVEEDSLGTFEEDRAGLVQDFVDHFLRGRRALAREGPGDVEPA